MFLWILVSVVVLLMVLVAYLDTRKPNRFPPGPRWYPLIGSAPQIHAIRRKWGSFNQGTAYLSTVFGPVIGLKIGKDPIVVVYGPQEVKEMSTSDDFVGRPIGSFFQLRTWDKRRGIILTDGELWQEQRRFLLRELKEFGFGTKNMSVLVEDEVAHLVKFVDESIGDKDAAIFDMESFGGVSVLNTLWRMIAGARFSFEDSRFKRLQSILSELFKTVDIVGGLFSHFPILKHVAPELSGYKCYMETHRKIWQFLQEELDIHKKCFDPHNLKDLMDVYLKVLNSPDHNDSFSEEQLVAICLDMFVAGSETTSNTFSFGFLYLIQNPHIQKKAQEEIDEVLGDRPPSLEDRLNLPYMEAVVLEALRMFGARAFTVPHRAVRDTYLGDHLIPKDVMLTINLHGCLMGPDSGFERPEVFDPTRYLKDGKICIPNNYFPFGLGKRRCMGESLARANLFLFTTSLLQKFEFQVVPEFPPDLTFVDGVTPAPSHYKARVIRR